MVPRSVALFVTLVGCAVSSGPPPPEPLVDTAGGSTGGAGPSGAEGVAADTLTASPAGDTDAAYPGETAPDEDATPDLAPAEDPEPCFPESHEARIQKVQPLVLESAARHEVDQDLVNGLIWVESKFNARARGPAGAQGLMQLMPRTARGIAKKLKRSSRPYDPAFNIEAGTYYLSRQLQKFDGNERLALAAYNRGAGIVKSWEAEGKELPEGTARFVERVLRARDCFERRRETPPGG